MSPSFFHDVYKTLSFTHGEFIKYYNRHKMQPTPSKRSYHPFMLIAYYLNFLPKEMLQAIPCSTRHEWKNKNPETLYGTAFFNENRALLNALEAVAQHKKLQTTIPVFIKHPSQPSLLLS